jgi:hypothetical protein
MAESLKKIRPTLVAMEIGETVSFPIIKLKSVRTQASELGAMFSRQYSTRIDRESGLIHVSRTLWQS